MSAFLQPDPGTPIDPRWTPWRDGATAPLERLEEIRRWLDGAFAESVTNERLTWLMVDIGWCIAQLCARASPVEGETT